MRSPETTPDPSRVVCIRVTTSEPARMYVTSRERARYVTRCCGTGEPHVVLAAADDLGRRSGLVAEADGGTWRPPVAA